MKKVSDSKQVVGVDKKIPFMEKLLYSSTNGIGTFYFMMIQMWLLFYYTDIIKISAGYVGVMFIVIRIVDSIICPLFGAYIDKQNTRWGRYKPWSILMWFGMIISGFLTFFPVSFGSTGNTIYATITYIVFSLFMSLGAAPGMGLTSSISKRQDDRMTISVIGFVWILLLSMVAQIGSQPLINILGKGNQAIGFRDFMFFAMIVFGIIFLIISIVTKERFTLKIDKSEPFNAKTIIEGLTKNKYAMITIIYTFSLNLSTATRSSAGIYYYKYYFNDANFLTIVGMICILPTLIGSFFSPLVTKKLGIKINLFVAVLTTLITSILMFFLPPTEAGKTSFLILSVIAGLFLGIAQPVQGTMLPLAVDYGEWKYNKNNGGFFGAVSGFAQTLSTAVSGGITALLLAVVHYIPDVQQTATTLNGIRFMMTVLPGLAIIFGFLILKWDITDAQHKDIIKELNERRKADQAS